MKPLWRTNFITVNLFVPALFRLVRDMRVFQIQKELALWQALLLPRAWSVETHM